jgi:hypothetical protein
MIVIVHTHNAARVWWFKSDGDTTAAWMQSWKCEEKNDREEESERDE